jgi:thiol-disulfide isomerase/thioredoxin
MTIASVLLALLTATSTPAGDSARPALLDFHAEWCGPCKKMRPAVEQLIRLGYPIKAIDIDQEAQLSRRYHVDSVPTFIVVDGSGREIDRTAGLQSAAELARFYKAAAAKALPPANSNAHTGSGSDAGDREDDHHDGDSRAKSGRNNGKQPQDDRNHDDDADQTEPNFSNPKPWETVVRIRVLSNRSTGFGSGTIIHSTPDESLILTCAHIFKLERQKQARPSEFPREIKIDLFDGNLTGTKPATVHFLEAVDGRAVDYDFVRDVGLIRVKPGRRLPSCRVVPTHWQPQPNMRVLTVGCSEGRDATAWHTIISKARIQNFLQGNPTYEAIECDVAPKQGRSGGGLFTDDGYLAGVCNFAEPQGNHGLYATPRSIYKLLDRNDLMALYAPVSRGSGTLLADRGAADRPRSKAPVAVARAQSPDPDDLDRKRSRADAELIVVPHPSRLRIPDPITAQADNSPQPASDTTRHIAWQPRPMQHAEPTDLNLDPAADHDPFRSTPGEAQTKRDSGDREESASPRSISGAGSNSRWRLVKPEPVNDDTAAGK